MECKDEVFLFLAFDVIEVPVKREYEGAVQWNGRPRFLAEESTGNSSLILAEKRTYRRDPLDGLKRYTGGWNISNEHYWAVSLSVFFFFFLLKLCSNYLSSGFPCLSSYNPIIAFWV